MNPHPTTWLAKLPETLPWNYGILGNRSITPIAVTKGEEETPKNDPPAEKYKLRKGLNKKES